MFSFLILLLSSSIRFSRMFSSQLSSFLTIILIPIQSQDEWTSTRRALACKGTKIEPDIETGVRLHDLSMHPAWQNQSGLQGRKCMAHSHAFPPRSCAQKEKILNIEGDIQICFHHIHWEKTQTFLYLLRVTTVQLYHHSGQVIPKPVCRSNHLLPIQPTTLYITSLSIDLHVL